MIWKEVEEKYGKKIADKMKKSGCLRGITVTKTKDGEINIPECDIKIAYKDVMGYPIGDWEWD